QRRIGRVTVHAEIDATRQIAVLDQTQLRRLGAAVTVDVLPEPEPGLALVLGVGEHERVARIGTGRGLPQWRPQTLVAFTAHRGHAEAARHAIAHGAGEKLWRHSRAFEQPAGA